MATAETSNSRPSAQEVRAELSRIGESDVFRDSPQLAAFLSFVVEAALTGQSDRIKGYTIAVEALGRPENFDPQADPIVRVEATRLRRALERYYAGADSPVQIELRRGSYVPAFSRRKTAPEKAPAELPPGNGMPVVLIEPFDVIARDGAPSGSTVTLHDRLCDAFARFDTINVVRGAGQPDVSSAFNYRLMGSVEYRADQTTSVRFRLLDRGGTVVWAQIFERLATTGGRDGAEDAIITELSAVLVQSYGVIRSNERTKHLSTGEGDPRQRYIVEASESFRSFDPAQHAKAREGLEHLIKIDPSFTVGFAYLAALYFREYQYGPYEKRDFAMLDRALELARRAVELKPESALAYQMLFGVLFTRREIAAAFAAGDKAIARNRHDMTILSDYGGRLIMSGEVERGMELMSKTAKFGIVRPSWYHFYLFLGSYLRGDLTNTIHHASQITGGNYPLGLVARALAAAMAGERTRARDALSMLAVASPNWRDNPRAQLERFFPVESLVERLAGDLARISRAAAPATLLSSKTLK